ncbi:MAG: hypothetical protein WC619_00130 [Patescibacteria group bacterium]
MIESFPGQLKPREIPPAEETRGKEPGVEADEKEKDREFSELVLAARKKADDILEEAFRKRREGKLKEDLELEKEAYRIFAALNILEVEIPENIRTAVKGQLEKSGIKGFISENSARDFLEGVVGNTQRKEEAEAA